VAFAVLAVWLSGSWASAQSRGHAVPRGGGGGNGGGHGAQVRHPAPGSGGGYGHYGGSYGYGHGHGYGYGYGYGYGHGHGYYGYGHYRGYYPYYGYGYPYYYGYYGYPYYGYGNPYYYGSGWGVGIGFGTPYASVGLSYHSGDSGYAGYAGDDPGYRSDAYARDYSAERDPGNPPPATDTGVVVLEVFPADASVYVDDEFRGAGQRRHSLRLGRGQHRLSVVHPRYPVFTRDLTVEPGDRVSVRVEMDRN